MQSGIMPGWRVAMAQFEGEDPRAAAALQLEVEKINAALEMSNSLQREVEKSNAALEKSNAALARAQAQLETLAQEQEELRRRPAHALASAVVRLERARREVGPDEVNLIPGPGGCVGQRLAVGGGAVQ